MTITAESEKKNDKIIIKSCLIIKLPNMLIRTSLPKNKNRTSSYI